jgi:O-antigen/teichoic acid export membrane protein
LVDVLLPERWAGVAPVLSVLAATSVLAPSSFMLASFLAALGKNGALMRIESGSLLTLVAALVVLSQWGIVVASGAVGIALAAQLAMSLAYCRGHGLTIRPALRPLSRLLLASAAMVLAVAAANLLLRPLLAGAPLLLLMAEVSVGAVVYVGTAWLLVRSLLIDVVRLLRPTPPHDATTFPSYGEVKP